MRFCGFVEILCGFAVSGTPLTPPPYIATHTCTDGHTHELKLILAVVRRDQVDLMISGREGKIFGSVGRENNNKDISKHFLHQRLYNSKTTSKKSIYHQICIGIFLAFYISVV